MQSNARTAQHITYRTSNAFRQTKPTFHSLHYAEQHGAHHLQQTEPALHNPQNTEQHAEHTSYTTHYLQYTSHDVAVVGMRSLVAVFPLQSTTRAYRLGWQASNLS
jgi:hypothetical protein